MTEAKIHFMPVATLDDLDALNTDEIVQGYRDYRSGDPEPGLNRGRAYWHGWCNRQRDEGRSLGTEASRRLARAWLDRG